MIDVGYLLTFPINQLEIGIQSNSKLEDMHRCVFCVNVALVINKE